MRQRFESWKQWSRRLKLETYVIYLAYRDPRVPRYAKLFIALIVAYAFSPIDLIPDFIPILGYLDDLVILPLGIMLALRMIPEDVMAESREKAQSVMGQNKPTSRAAAAAIILFWILLAALIISTIF